MSDSVGDRMVKATEPTRGSSLWEETKAAAKKYLGPKEDTSWHDSMVTKANAGYAKAAADPKLGGKKKTKKATKKKSMTLAKR